MSGKAKALSKEEELLLQDFSRNVSTKSSALFYGNAFIVSVIPLWLFWRIQQMDPMQSWYLWIVMTLASTWLIAFGYKNVKFVLKHKYPAPLFFLFRLPTSPRSGSRRNASSR